MFFFFFQAEDGIRDIGVTGVQTCALPISYGTENISLVVDKFRRVFPIPKEIVKQKAIELIGNDAEPKDAYTYEGKEGAKIIIMSRSEEHTSELQSRQYLVCRLLLEKKKKHTDRLLTKCTI